LPSGKIAYEPVYIPTVDYENLGPLKLFAIYLKKPVGTLLLYPKFPFFRWIPCVDTQIETIVGDEEEEEWK
jgi:hypothetical protein